jgi:hypothetical protein
MLLVLQTEFKDHRQGRDPGAATLGSMVRWVRSRTSFLASSSEAALFGFACSRAIPWTAGAEQDARGCGSQGGNRSQARSYFAPLSRCAMHEILAGKY